MHTRLGLVKQTSLLSSSALNHRLAESFGKPFAKFYDQWRAGVITDKSCANAESSIGCSNRPTSNAWREARTEFYLLAAINRLAGVRRCTWPRLPVMSTGDWCRVHCACVDVRISAGVLAFLLARQASLGDITLANEITESRHRAHEFGWLTYVPRSNSGPQPDPPICL